METFSALLAICAGNSPVPMYFMVTQKNPPWYGNFLRIISLLCRNPSVTGVSSKQMAGDAELCGLFY